MNKNEFLQQLRNGLCTFPEEERQSAIAYYEEFFEEAGPDNEQAVIASLGDPNKLAESILSESRGNSDESVKPIFTPPQTPNAAYNSTSNNVCRNILIVFLLLLS